MTASLLVAYCLELAYTDDTERRAIIHDLKTRTPVLETIHEKQARQVAIDACISIFNLIPPMPGNEKGKKNER